MNKRRLFPFLACSLLLTSCSSDDFLSDFIGKTPDPSALYLGGYSKVYSQDSSGKSYDYFLYVQLRSASVPFSDSLDYQSSSFNPAYDLEICLSSCSDTLGQVGDSNSKIRFFDFSSWYSKTRSGSVPLEAFFNGGNYLAVFSSVGRLDLLHPLVSRWSKVSSSGRIVAFSCISTGGEELKYTSSVVYKEKFFLGGHD